MQEEFAFEFTMTLKALENFRGYEVEKVFPFGNVTVLRNDVVVCEKIDGELDYFIVGESPRMIMKELEIHGDVGDTIVIGEDQITQVTYVPVMARARRWWRKTRRTLQKARFNKPSMEFVRDVEIATEDKENLITAFRGNEKDIDSMISSKKATRHGRSIFLNLKRPIEVDGVQCMTLKLKGVTPKFYLRGLFHKKYRSTAQNVRVDGERIFLTEKIDKDPFGAMSIEAFEKEVEREYLNYGQFIIGHGAYGKNMRFIVYALGEPDYRLISFLRGMFRIDQATFEKEKLTEEASERAMLELGKSLRQIHDLGESHGMLHLMNVSGDGSIIRDWETGQKIERDMRGVGLRLIDMIRPMIDATVEQNSIAVYRCTAFLVGYFNEIPANSKTMNDMVFELSMQDFGKVYGGVDLSRMFPTVTAALRAITMTDFGVGPPDEVGFDEIFKNVESIKKSV